MDSLSTWLSDTVGCMMDIESVLVSEDPAGWGKVCNCAGSNSVRPSAGADTAVTQVQPGPSLTHSVFDMVVEQLLLPTTSILTTRTGNASG